MGWSRPALGFGSPTHVCSWVNSLDWWQLCMSRTHCWCPSRWQGKELVDRKDTGTPGTPWHDWSPLQQAAGYKTWSSSSQKKMPIKNKTKRRRGRAGCRADSWTSLKGTWSWSQEHPLPGCGGREESPSQMGMVWPESQHPFKCCWHLQRVFQKPASLLCLQVLNTLRKKTKEWQGANIPP